MTEKQIQADILATYGGKPWCRIWRHSTGVGLTPDGNQVVRYGLVGSADLSGILSDGRRLEIEVKSAKGRQRQQQKQFQRMIERFNGIYILARSVDDVARVLEGQGYQ